jgi:hypothetical protein
VIEGDPAEYLKAKARYAKKKLLVVYSMNYSNNDYLWTQLFEFVEKGNYVLFILGEDPQKLKFYYSYLFNSSSVLKEKTILNFSDDKKEKYEYDKLDEFEPVMNKWNYFVLADSVKLQRITTDEEADRNLYQVANYSRLNRDTSYKEDTLYYDVRIHERNENGKAVYIELPTDDGAFFIHKTPIAFSNISLLEEKNIEHLEKVLSKIDYKSIVFNVPAKPKIPRGNPRKAKESPLQFILSNDALAWAYYTIIGGLILFLIFNLKRRQKAIAILPSKNNSTLEFADAVSKVYFQKHNNQNLVKHKQRIFTTFIRTRYQINPAKDLKEYARMISAKSGIESGDVEKILNTFESYLKLKEVTDDQLIVLHKLIDNFNKHCK